MEEEIIILLLLKEINKRKRKRCQLLKSLRDSSDPFNLPDAEFTKNFKFGRSLCRQFIDELRPYDQQKTSLPFELRVLCSLYFLAHGSYQKCVGNNTNLPMSQPSDSRCLSAFVELVAKVKGNQIKFPITSEEKNTIKSGFHSRFGIKCTIGAIDCTHVAIVSPNSTNPEQPLTMYMNRKGFYSINVEAICEHRLRFLYVNPKFPGATHDSGIWATSEVREHLIRTRSGDRNNWLIGDQGYPLEPWLMTPLSNRNTAQEKKYNKMHASARNCKKRAFGVLKMRFRCLCKHRVLHYSHKKAADIINCCAILHNILLNRGDNLPDIDISDVNDKEESSHNDSQFSREGERIRRRYIETL